MRPDDEVAKDDVKVMRQFRRDALAALPGFFEKLTGAYNYRVYWFEVHTFLTQTLQSYTRRVA